MTFRDDSSHAPNEHHALVAGQQQPGDSLMVQQNSGAIAPPLVPGMPTPGAHHVLRGSMDANTFMHALRRRWLLALCMGLVMGGALALALWFIFPESSSATALFQVEDKRETIFDISHDNDDQNYETLKKTQLALLKSNFVLTAAIRPPSVASLSALAGRKDPVVWLQDTLSVDYPQNGKLLSITLSGDELPEEQVQLVNAVAKAYKDEVIDEARQRRLVVRDMLSRNIDTLNVDVKRKLDEYLDIARESGLPQHTDRADAETELLLRDISDTQQKKDSLTSQMYQTQTDFMIMKSDLEDPGVLEAQIDDAIGKDPQVLMMKEKQGEMQMAMSASAGSAKGNSRQNAQSQKQLEALNRQIEQYKAQLKAKDAARNCLEAECAASAVDEALPDDLRFVARPVGQDDEGFGHQDGGSQKAHRTIDRPRDARGGIEADAGNH